MKSTDDSRFHFVYILATFATAPGGLKRYFFSYVNHHSAITFAKQNYGQ